MISIDRPSAKKELKESFSKGTKIGCGCKSILDFSHDHFLDRFQKVATSVSSASLIYKQRIHGVEWYELNLLNKILKHWKEDSKSFISETEHKKRIDNLLGKAELQSDGKYVIPIEDLDRYHKYVYSAFMVDFVHGIKIDKKIKDLLDENYAEGRISAEDEVLELIIGKSLEFSGKAEHKYEYTLKQAYDFDAIDQTTLDMISEDFYYWMGESYDTAVADKINTIAYDVINQGLGQEAATDAFTKHLGKEYASLGRAYFNILSSTVINTSRNFGSLRTYAENEIRYYEFLAIVDGRTTQMCLDFNGRTFSVETTIGIVQELVMAMSAEDVKTIKPFLSWDDNESKSYFVQDGQRIYVPTGKTPDDNAAIAKWGISIPPIHFLCRSTIVISASETFTLSRIEGIFKLFEKRGIKISIV